MSAEMKKPAPAQPPEAPAGAVSAEFMLWKMAKAWVEYGCGRSNGRVLAVPEAGSGTTVRASFAPRFHTRGFLADYAAEGHA